MSTVTLFYTTFSSKTEALEITKVLLEKRLIACANIMAESTSVYRWKGKVETTNEIPALLKSKSENRLAIEQCIKELHSFDCPCILELKVENGNKEFLEWIIKETNLEAN